MNIIKLLLCTVAGVISATFLTVGAWHVQIEPRAFQCRDSIGVFDTYWEEIDGHRLAGDKISPGWTWDEIKVAREHYIWAFYGIWALSSAAIYWATRKAPSKFLGSGLERFVAGLFLVTGLPMLLLISFLICSTGGGPVIICDETPNENGTVMRRLRFRTTGRGTPLFRAVGRLLRRFSVDEFPALWNVIRGDLSLNQVLPD